MQKLLFIAFCALSMPAMAQISVKGRRAKYTIDILHRLSTDAALSAGVYKTDGTLVRTLLSGKQYAAGDVLVQWDRKDDAGNLVDTSLSYKIDVTSNNLTTEWLGIVGNTSSANSGSTIYHSGDVTRSMVFVGTTGYFAVGYNEGYAAHFKFSSTSPQAKTDFMPGYGQSTQFEATDGVRVYHGGEGPQVEGDVEVPRQFIFATKVSDDTEVSFSSGYSYQPRYSQRTYLSAIDTTVSTLPNNDPNYDGYAPLFTMGGLAVQASGNYLFASYFDRNEIHVLNKITGALVRKITTFTNPTSLAIDGSDNLWVCSGTNTVSKHTVNSDGTLTTATLSLSGLVKPLCVASKGTLVAVADGSTKQQIRFFNNSTGTEGTALGQVGGYATSPNVANDKFMFKNTKEIFRDEQAFVCFGSDNSIWVGDRGNYRVQHFAANLTFIETVMSMGYFYTMAVDRNNISRVFANYLEFSVDYSKPVSPLNGSWTLVKNWAFPITVPFDNQFSRLKNVSTLSNGRTYALQSHTTGSGSSKVYRWQVVELPPSGNLRFTGVEPQFTFTNYDLDYAMDKDGSLFRTSATNVGSPMQWLRRPLTGFDGSNNPLWGSEITVASISNLNINDPVVPGGGAEANHTSSDGKVFSFYYENNDTATGRGGGYHLGAVAPSTNSWLWRSAPSTIESYLGEFPVDGGYDIGNGVNNPGGFMNVLDNLVVWGYHGEFWKGSQTNKWVLYADNGLYLGQFGEVGTETKHIGESRPGMAGNAVAGGLVKYGSDYYLLHCDEGQHCGVHIWKIGNVASLQTSSYAINFPRNAVVPGDGVDLMAGLPYNGPLVNNTNGWTRSPASEMIDAANNQFWTVTTSKLTYRKEDRDLLIKSYPSSNGLTRWVRRDLGTNTGLTSWKIDGKIGYPELGEPDQNFIEVLDAADRVIVRFSRPPGASNTIDLRANSTVLKNAPTDSLFATFNRLQPLSIRTVGSNITVSYANYSPVTVSKFDGAADATNPTTLRVTMYSADNRGHQLGISNFRFYPQ